MAAAAAAIRPHSPVQALRALEQGPAEGVQPPMAPQEALAV